MTLDQPQIVLTRQATSGAAPLPPANPAEAGITSGTPSASAPFQFTLEHIRVNNGTLSVRDASGGPMADLQSIDTDANTSGYTTGQDVTGTIRVATSSCLPAFT